MKRRHFTKDGQNHPRASRQGRNRKGASIVFTGGEPRLWYCSGSFPLRAMKPGPQNRLPSTLSVLGSPAHAASSSERPRAFCPPEKMELIGDKATFFLFFLLFFSKGPTVRFHIRSTVWSHVRRVWNGRFWGEMWGSSYWIPSASTYLHITAAIFLEKSKPLPGEKQSLHPVGNHWESSSGILLDPSSGIPLTPPCGTLFAPPCNLIPC